MTMMPHLFMGDNPSQLYMDALETLVTQGKETNPRGKRCKELYPVTFAYTNPLRRVTFLKGRVINPFFQLAESFWILMGRSDVAFLTHYNESIAQFSDNGVHFNAPYGERLRFWGKNDASGTIYNPIDQLKDVMLKIQADPDTRQAVAMISDQRYDNSTVETKDRACNIALTFRNMEGKLNLFVHNRSNDLHWGTFGANLAQFATIQECVAVWLGLEVGTYYQISDCLHIYLDEYGAKETDKVFCGYGMNGAEDLEKLWENKEIYNTPRITHFEFEQEPRMTSNYEQFHQIVALFHTRIEPLLHSDELFSGNYHTVEDLIDFIADPYWRMTFTAMLAYRCHKAGRFGKMIRNLEQMPNCQWKIACLRFLSKKYGDREEFRALYEEYGNPEVISYINREDITL